METVLVIGSTGSIGVSAVTAALRSKRNVLANVRNKASADKLIRYVGSPKGITFAEADALSEFGVKGVVDQVKAGKLPAFQHVYACRTSHSTEFPDSIKFSACMTHEMTCKLVASTQPLPA